MKRDERSITEQVKSGFRIVGAILASFAAFLVFGTGYRYVTGPEQQHVVIGWILLLATVVTMLVSVRLWANWFCGIVSYAAVCCIFLLVSASAGWIRAPVWYVVSW